MKNIFHQVDQRGRVGRAFRSQVMMSEEKGLELYDILHLPIFDQIHDRVKVPIFNAIVQRRFPTHAEILRRRNALQH